MELLILVATIVIISLIIACIYFVRTIKHILDSQKTLTVVGSDGSGKSTLTKCLVRELENLGYSAGIIHLPRYKEAGGYPAFFGKYIYGFFANLAERIQSRRMKIFSLLYNGIALLTPISKLILISKDIVIKERHLRIDSAAMAYFYAPNTFLSSLAMVLTRIESEAPKIIVFVELDDPKIAFERIKKRLLIDKKYPHLHEKSLDLIKMSQKRYGEIIQKIKSGEATIIRVNGKNPIEFNCFSVIETLKNIGFIKPD